MKLHKTPLDGFIVIEPDLFLDDRGFFLETYQEERYYKAGIIDKFVQDNHSRSAEGVLRGMHFQIKNPQAQIITIMSGSVYYVCVDLRRNSSTFGRWHGVELSDKGMMQMYMAPGFAGGFCVLEGVADLHYKVSGEYDPYDEGGLVWNDPDIAIQWPSKINNISDRDEKFSKLINLEADELPWINL